VSFVSANYDPDVFPDPDRVYLTRERIPHVAFGFGPHTCIGNHLAEIETEALLVEVLPDLPRWTIVGDPRIEWTTVNGFAFPQRIDEVRVRIKG
jgi:biflaviolin synthase